MVNDIMMESEPVKNDISLQNKYLQAGKDINKLSKAQTQQIIKQAISIDINKNNVYDWNEYIDVTYANQKKEEVFMIDSKKTGIARAYGNNSYQAGKIQFDTNTQNKNGGPPGTGNNLTFSFGLA